MSILEFNRPANANDGKQDNKVQNNTAPTTKGAPELFRLVTGEEVVATVASENKESVNLKNPVRIVVIPQQGGGNPQVGMVPLTNFSDDEVFSIDWTFIMFRAKASSNLAAEYTRATTGLVTPVVPKLLLPK